MLVGAPLQLAEQAPGLVVDAAIEVGLRVGTIIAVVHAAEQAQAVGQAQGVLDFQVVAGFAGALVDVAADWVASALIPLIFYLTCELF
ncbi:hypothetical protein D3C73_1506470 [compost metagenome]